MTAITTEFRLERTTPGAARYAEVGKDGNLLTPNDPFANIGTLYIRRRAFNDHSIPERITITVEAK
jgi:hypothetical protein